MHTIIRDGIDGTVGTDGAGIVGIEVFMDMVLTMRSGAHHFTHLIETLITDSTIIIITETIEELLTITDTEEATTLLLEELPRAEEITIPLRLEETQLILEQGEIQQQ